MLKKIVGAIATLSIMVGTLGMGYPQEKGRQQEAAYLVYSEAVTSRMSEETLTSAQAAGRIQTQGARSITKYAEKEARIQEATMPLIMNEVEATKKKNISDNRGITASARSGISRSKGRKQRSTIYGGMCGA